MQRVYRVHKSSLGRLHLIADASSLLVLAWDETISAFKERLAPLETRRSHPILDLAVQEIEAYTAKQSRTFTVPWTLHGGTPFQHEVWRALGEIPYGQTLSYSELAQKVARPSAVRAVGAANAKNPLSLVLPCPRVIGKDGSLTGFAGGVSLKQKLINLEKN